MILRREVVQDRLQYLRTIIRRLDEIREVPRQEFLDSYQRQWVVERGLQLAVQVILDIGTHILSGHFNVHPRDHEDVFRLLARHGVLPEDLERRLRGMGSFRNILVHAYLEIDVEIVYGLLRGDSLAFRDFANVIDEWLKGV